MHFLNVTSCSTESQGVAQHQGISLPATFAEPVEANQSGGKGGSKAALNFKCAALLSQVPPASEYCSFSGVRDTLKVPSLPRDLCCQVMPTADLPHPKERFPSSQGQPGYGAGQNAEAAEPGLCFYSFPHAAPPQFCKVPAYTLELAQRESSLCQKTSLVQIISLLEQ